MILAKDPVWTFWLAVPIFALVVVSIIALAASYFVKVVRPKYPPRSSRNS